MKDNKERIKNYTVFENLVLNIVQVPNGSLFLSCDVYYHDMFNRVDFEITDKNLKIVYIDTDIKSDEQIFYKLITNQVKFHHNKITITLDSIFQCNKDYSFTIKINETFCLDTVSKSRYDIFDKLDNKFCLYYVRKLIESKQLYSNYNFIYENIDKILEFIKITETSRINFYNNSQNIRYDLKDGITAAQKFLDNMNIKINITDLLQDGILIFTKDFATNKGLSTGLLSGESVFDKEKHKRIINICQTNDLTMVAVLIHELLHYYNQPTDNNRSIPSKILTEVISYSYELIFLDSYLSGKYQKDAEDIFRKILNSLRWASFFTYAPAFSLKLYKDSNLTMEEIEKKMSLENYFSEMTMFVQNKNTIARNLWNIIGYYLAIYSYIEYKKSCSFTDKLLKLNDSMGYKSFIECLKIIDLNSIDDALEKGVVHLEECANFVNHFEK